MSGGYSAAASPPASPGSPARFAWAPHTALQLKDEALTEARLNSLLAAVEENTGNLEDWRVVLGELELSLGRRSFE